MESTTTFDCSWCVGGRIAEHGHESSGQSRVSPLSERHGHMERDGCWKNTGSAKNVQEFAQVDPGTVAFECSSIIATSSLGCSESNRSTLRFENHGSSRHIANSNRQDVEVDHLNRTDDYIVVGSVTAVSAVSRTFAAHGPLRQGRQLLFDRQQVTLQHTMVIAPYRCS